MDIRLVEQQCDFDDGIDEMIQLHQPRVSKPHKNDVDISDKAEFFVKIKR